MVSNLLTYTIAASLPATTSAGIVNAASYLPSIAPGSLVAIYGSNFAAATAQADTLPLPTALRGTQVLVNDTPAPMLFVSPGQINIQVPYEIPVGTAHLVVRSAVGTSTPANFTVTPTGPGVITLPVTNHALAVNVTGGALNSANAPAVPGEYLTAYVTGQGQVNPAVPTGSPAVADPLSYLSAPIQVTISGQPADVQFAGMAPGFVGLMQLNILVPVLGAGEQNLEVTIGGVAANVTTVSIGSN
jgi:uncharacterized protein (TIGR03437 family)